MEGRGERPVKPGTGGTTQGLDGWGTMGHMTGGGLRRDELAEFLRTRRARLRPADVGLPEGLRRRTPGLRRQEVAQLAGISVDYHIRLEQGRGPRPSRQVLAALTRALLLTRDERDYLFRLVGEVPDPVTGPSSELSAGLRQLMDAMIETPAYVVSARYDVLAWNRWAVPFMGGLAEAPPEERNFVRVMFRRPADDPAWSDPETLRFVRGTVADLRAAYGRYPGDAELARLVTELLGTSPWFARMWAEHDVEVRRTMVKRVCHPELGPLEFECQVLHLPDTDQRMVVYLAAPGSRTESVFRRGAAVAKS